MALKLRKQPLNTEAKWFEFDEETKVQLIGINNPGYQTVLERAQRRINRNDAKFEQGQIGLVEGEKSAHESHCMILAQFIVQDWDGVVDEDGNKVAFSNEVATELLSGNIEFFMWVISKASELAAEGKADLAETVEKPSPATTGKKSGPAKPKKESASISA
jgi:dihydroorotate dehydrogenase